MGLWSGDTLRWSTATRTRSGRVRACANIVLYRIAEIEEKIGAGLVEEVIEVAEGELKLVDTMLKNKV